MDEFKYNVKLLKKEQIAKETWYFEFIKPKEFNFLAGQFIGFSIPKFDEEIIRYYSIVSIPTDPHLGFIIKFIEGGKASQFFDKMILGEKLDMTEAFGKLTINQKAISHFFITTGTGVVPMISMVRDELTNKKTNKKIHVLFGLKDEEYLFCQKEMDYLEKKFSNFSCQITLSDASETWAGLRGRVTNYLPKELDNKDFYLCGCAPMIIDVKKYFREKNVDNDKIHFEIY